MVIWLINFEFKYCIFGKKKPKKKLKVKCRKRNNEELNDFFPLFAAGAAL